MQVMGLYPANSLFMEGYLNTVGTKIHDTLQMIKDGGFEILSDKMLENLIAAEAINVKLQSETDPLVSESTVFKDLSLLRPNLVSDS
jgi:biotin synthase